MSQSYEETITELYGLRRLGMRPGLESTRALLRALGSPEEGLRTVHIAGTNGKGSTAAMIDSVMRASGYRTGLYTSPHLSDFGERIQVSGRPMERDALGRLAARVLGAAAGLRRETGLEVTFFEAATAMAFLRFMEEGVDLAIMETGMGGRLDATNVTRPLLTIITNVDIDHSACLGGTVEAIAAEKAGIIKRGVPLITGALSPEAAAIISKRAAEVGASQVLRLYGDFTFEDAGDEGIDYHGPGLSLKGIEVGLCGAHQKQNAALAISALEVLGGFYPAIDEAAIREGLKGVSWPGRLEEISREPRVILDCAHNPAGARALAKALGTALAPSTPVTLVAGISADKDIKGIIGHLIPLARRVIFTEARTERAAHLGVLIEAAQALGMKSRGYGGVAEAMGAAIKGLLPGEVIVVAGSVFVVGEARDFFLRTGAAGSGKASPGAAARG